MPRFLERDEGDREVPVEKYPVGRRLRRQTLPRLRDDHGGRRFTWFSPGRHKLSINK